MDPIGVAAAVFSVVLLVSSAQVEHHNRRVTDCRMTTSAEFEAKCPAYKTYISDLEDSLKHLPLSYGLSRFAKIFTK